MFLQLIQVIALAETTETKRNPTAVSKRAARVLCFQHQAWALQVRALSRPLAVQLTATYSEHRPSAEMQEAAKDALSYL